MSVAHMSSWVRWWWPVRDERCLARVRRLCQTDASVLIEGESGSEKRWSPGDSTIRCIPQALDRYQLRASEKLIGERTVRVRTGGSAAPIPQAGAVRTGAGGTSVLDEIAIVGSRLQVKVLRFWDCGEFYVWAHQEVKVDVGFGCHNRTCRFAGQQGRFRKDLYHRLAQIGSWFRPCATAGGRAGDAAHSGKYGLQADFSTDAARLLSNYAWPGNVRELRNVIVACVANSRRAEIHPDDLPVEILEAAGGAISAHGVPCNGSGRHEAGTAGTLEAAERRLILHVLQQTDGHQEKAARILGISSRTLGRKLKAYRLAGQAAAVDA